MELLFKGANEFIKLVLDRKNKKAQISTSKTHYQLTPVSWTQLFDKGKERIQERITDKIDDERFKQVMIQSMTKQGYLLVKNESTRNGR